MIVIAEEVGARESDYGSDEACLSSSQRMCVETSVCERADGGGGDIWYLPSWLKCSHPGNWRECRGNRAGVRDNIKGEWRLQRGVRKHVAFKWGFSFHLTVWWRHLIRPLCACTYAQHICGVRQIVRCFNPFLSWIHFSFTESNLHHSVLDFKFLGNTENKAPRGQLPT